jgi:hypothetical protein
MNKENNQSNLRLHLTGYQRFVLVKLWHKRGREGLREDFVKKVCEQKGIIYTPPIEIKR